MVFRRLVHGHSEIMMDTHRDHALHLFLTAGHPCSYLPGRLARNLVLDPKVIDNGLYSLLAQQGFRRSSNYIYRPHCTACTQCLSLRIPVSGFQPNRSQRRIWNKNRDLATQAVAARFNSDHYKLFKRYLQARHPNGGMDGTTPESYLAFISSPWSDTVLYEFRLARQLSAVAVTDRLDNALSAVYTFFDPDESARSLGTYAILWQIDEARRKGYQWVYLGYWIRDSEKMAYKACFQPHQIFLAGHWISPTNLRHTLPG